MMDTPEEERKKKTPVQENLGGSICLRNNIRVIFEHCFAGRKVLFVVVNLSNGTGGENHSNWNRTGKIEMKLGEHESDLVTKSCISPGSGGQC